jgi:hypothetical protein
VRSTSPSPGYRRWLPRANRVVPVGTHALTSTSRTSSWQRLSQHRAAPTHGGGNHRASIFRLLVGEALTCRDGLSVPTWGCGSTASRAARGRGLTTSDVLNAERELEVAVSRYLGALGLLCMPVEEADGTARAPSSSETRSPWLAGTDRHRRARTSPSWLGYTAVEWRCAARACGTSIMWAKCTIRVCWTSSSGGFV